MSTDSEEDDVYLSELSKADRGRIAIKRESAKLIKTVGISIGIILGAMLPFSSSIIKDRENSRAKEVEQSKIRSETALSVSKSTLTQLTELSEEMGAIKNKNTELQSQNETFRKNFTELEKEYKFLQAQAESSIKEREELRKQLDELLKAQDGKQDKIFNFPQSSKEK